MLGKFADWSYRPLLVYPDWSARFVYVLIFLFPVAGMSIGGWLTNIFNVLVLFALFTLSKPREPLLRQERVFIWICAAYFTMFIVSSLANGWGTAQTRGLGTELRFLLVIPLYLLVRRYPDSTQWLLRGSILGGIVIFGQAYKDVFIDGQETAWGIYSKNLIGPFAVLIAFWGMYFLWQSRRRLHAVPKFLVISSVVAALGAVGLSGSRGAYVGLIITGLLCVMFFSRPRWMFASLAGMALTGVLLYQVAIVKNRIDLSFTEVQNYLQAKDHSKDSSSATSTGIRLEMMRTGLLLIRDNPLLGFGPGNYKKSIKKYIAENRAHPAIGEHGYPHNAFLEVATAKGVLGLTTLLLLFYYPAAIYLRGYKTCKPTAVLGLIHVAALSAFSLTDHSVVIMNNYTSILLLGTVIFFSAHLRACKEQR